MVGGRVSWRTSRIHTHIDIAILQCIYVEYQVLDFMVNTMLCDLCAWGTAAVSGNTEAR
jgi:hypothetical protein